MKSEALKELNKRRTKLFIWFSIFVILGAFVAIFWNSFLGIIILIPLMFCIADIFSIHTKIWIVTKGEFKSFDIVGNEKKILSRGFIKYFPVVTDDETHKSIIVKDKSHTAPFLVGGKIKAFKFESQYYFF